MTWSPPPGYVVLRRWDGGWTLVLAAPPVAGAIKSKGGKKP